MNWEPRVLRVGDAFFRLGARLGGPRVALVLYQPFAHVGRRWTRKCLARIRLGPTGPYAYHATDEPDAVLREGLRRDKSRGNLKEIWLANAPENANPFGKTLLEVDAAALGIGFRPDQWQIVVPDMDIPPQFIRVYQEAV
jgi:hypothetical protein